MKKRTPQVGSVLFKVFVAGEFVGSQVRIPAGNNKYHYGILLKLNIIVASISSVFLIVPNSELIYSIWYCRNNMCNIIVALRQGPM